MKQEERKQERLDLCFAAHRFHPDYSGAGIRFQRYAPELRQRGIDMRVFTGTPRQQSNPARPSRNNFKTGDLLPLQYIDDLLVQRVKLPEGNARQRHMTYVSALLRYCRQRETRPDLIQAISVSQYWLPWWFSLRRLGIPVVYSYTLLGNLSSHPVKRQLQRIYWRLPFEMVDCVVASSSVVRRVLRDDFGVRTRIEVIPNGVDLQRFRPVESATARNLLRKQLDIELSAEIILFVGPVVERKGVDILLEAWKLIARGRQQTYLLLVGPDYRDRPHPFPEFGAKVEKLVSNSGAKDRVIFLGVVDRVERYFQAADIFVFPSKREGMGNVVLEAFACGLSSVLTPFIGFPDEFGNPGEHYLLVESDPRSLAASIITMLDNPEYRKQIGNQAREWVEAHLGMERSIEKYAKLYRDLVDQPRRMQVKSSTWWKPNLNP